MKGTLFTADFVRDNSNNLRLIEVNTDTAIQASLVDRLDWSGLISTLTSNNLTELHIIYKSVQAPLVDNLESAVPSGITVERHLEGSLSIYPAIVEDAPNKFILRLAYDQGAILDSEYAAKDLNLYSLFADNSASDKVPGFYYTGSESSNTYDTLEDRVNETSIADLLVRNTVSLKGGDIALYKAPTGIAAAKSALSTDSSIITNYYKPAGSTKPTSIRSYQIIYGSSLDVLFIGSYELEAIFNFPSSLTTDGDATAAKIARKHYSELTTEGINRAAGVKKGQSIIRQDGGTDLAEAVIAGDIYASYFVNGAPDTDDYGTLFNWSHAGSELPEGSKPTGSMMIKSAHPNDSANNSVVSITLQDGTNLKLGALSSILVYQTSTDTIKYLYVSELSLGDSLFDKDGNKKVIASLEVEILDTVEEATTYELNLESTDIFSVEGSSVIVHNGPCFVAGTKVSVVVKNGYGEKNIEDIVVGDQVVTFNHELNKQEYNKVLKIRVQDDKETFILETSNGSIVEATPDHPFHTENKGYASLDPVLCKDINDMNVAQLEIGDTLHTIGDQKLTVAKLTRTDSNKKVYNLEEVEKNHNFYVNGLLVHNRYK